MISKRYLHGILCGASIILSLMIYSLLQERIMTKPYEHEGNIEFFSNSLLLVLANRILAVFIAFIILIRNGEISVLHSSKVPLFAYVLPSISNVIATSCQYEALKWLTFPTVTIGKCAKMLPVMLILNLRKRKHYRYDDFAVAGAVIMGCAIMVRAGKVAAAPRGANAAESDTATGFVLMATYLLFDAITSTSQQRLFERYDTSVSNQMLFINISSAVLSGIGLVGSGGAAESISFVGRYPKVAPDIAALSAAAVAGQFAISHTIHAFGALLYAGVMTSRQFASVLASDFLFEHGLNAGQWFGAILVFSSLFFKLFRKAQRGAEDD